ncbi:MAG: D-xylose ABC transporter ATP-binding protein [Thermoprotei archaeon]|nr:MAG: D-xylose ABC transporter ATP-binding protein [Thermoprotei archaeon]
MPASGAVVLEARGIVKKFPGVVALKKVDFNLRSGEVHALVGQNGAGKSTFVKIVNGILRPDEGEIRVFGKKVFFKSPADAKRHGITLVHQEITLVPHMSVAENISLARIPTKIKGFGLLDKKFMEELATKVLDELGLHLNPWIKVKELSVGEQQLVQIARALAENANIICLDEPTSALTPAEVERLFEVINVLRRQGKAIIFITHHIDEVFRIADRVTILRDGHKIATLPISETDPQEVIKLMLGREPEQFYIRRRAHRVEEKQKPILVVKNLSTQPAKARGVRLKDISFELYPNEILGVVGLLGSGKTELGKALIGMEKVVKGEILFKGRRVRIKSPIDALKLGIFYLPEDRQKEGLVLLMRVRENIVISSLKNIVNILGVRRINLEKKIASEWVRKLNIVTPSIDAKVMNLSGGNQQKVVVAKALQVRPQILIFDEPTMGIDVGAKVEIRKIIADLANKGYSIILLSSDIDEVLALADRILVLSKGVKVASLINEGITRDELMRLMSQSIPP